MGVKEEFIPCKRCGAQGASALVRQECCVDCRISDDWAEYKQRRRKADQLAWAEYKQWRRKADQLAKL